VTDRARVGDAFREKTNPAPTESGLTLSDVVAGYRRGPVVHGVSIRVRRGEVVGLVGPNGSGKTTVLRVASRALRPSGGSVMVEGHDPYRMPARRAARLVAVVPQDVAPAFEFTVRELVEMGRGPYVSPWGGASAADRSRVEAAMRAANVEELADRPAEELSGGERQRVILAQALAQDAPVLLLDEPTTHLDLRHVVETLDAVARLARDENRAVLAIFHDLTLAGAYCDRIYALASGRVVAEGRPEHVIVEDLIEAVFGVDVNVVVTPNGRPAVVFSRDGIPRQEERAESRPALPR
jgi:iron complex transport system ATP-binding protein